ncbi:MAG: KpsF/GutQ family sugar-phosphate isomerase [Rhodobacteraceae bacterium]|nr:KpsF/GutQ family sugar-phosphate isomerase [Paracoccaceae bacterium]
MNPPSSTVKSLRLALSALEVLLGKVQNGLGDEIERALDVIEAARGRLIVVGIGKSGHIAAKLAASFASTGTPAFFVHPTEASHGDLGMIAPQDVVLLISKSGETRELQDIIAYCKRFGMKMVALTSVADSVVGRAADVVLVLPPVREACPNDLAPTTSTLLTMALGDALAVALVERRGFSERNFHDFHPGGKLGAQLVPVREIMRTEALPLVAADAPVNAGLAVLTKASLGIVGVQDKAGALIGVITDGDVRRHLEASAESSMKAAMWETSVAEIMSDNPVTIPPDIMAVEALACLQAHSISVLFVVQAGRPIGVVSFLSLLQAGVA